MEPRALHADCANCPLYTPPRRKGDPQVNGSGPDRADVVVVGMAPGATEVTLKKPFVGPSGRLLNTLLADAGLSRDDVYCTNAVLCSTHDGNGNQPVPAAAISACRARLYVELKHRRPKVVLALGNDVLRAFGIDEKVGDCRGRERWISFEHLHDVLLKAQKKTGAHLPVDLGGWDRDGFYLLPAYHPAYVLRSTDRTPDLAKDIARIPAVLEKAAAEQRTYPDVDYRVAQGSEEAIALLNSIAPETRQKRATVACDIESTGLDPITGRLLTVAYAWREDGQVRALVIPWGLIGDPAVRGALVRLHGRHDLRFVWWNGKFDRKWFVRHLTITPRLDGDGMLCHYVGDARKGVHGLKERASDDLGADDYERELDATGRRKKPDWSRIAADYEAGVADVVERVHHYTALDVGMTLQLTEQYEKELSADADWVYRNILLSAAAVLSDVELAGVAVDTGALADLDGRFQALLADYTARMRAAAAAPQLNVASQPQIATVLYGHDVRQRFPSIDKATTRDLPAFGLPLVLNQKRTPGTGAEHCDKLLNTYPLGAREQDFVRALRSYRLDAQLHRTYVKKLPQVVHADGRVRANFNLHVTGSGRLSSSEPFNLQNIPTRRQEGGQIKDAFVAAPGCVLVEVDLSQAELRTAAFLSGDPTLTAIYRDGRDFHHEVALRILGSEERAKQLRPYIKTFNFALMYGAEPRMLTTLLNDLAIETEQRTNEPQVRWSEWQVEELYDEFWVNFPVLKGWLDGVRRQVRETGEATSHFGRTRRWYVETPETAKEAGNHPVQSTAADILTLGMIEVHRWLSATAMGRIVLTVHDSLVLEVPEGCEVKVAQQVVRILESIPAKYGITVPFAADAKIGTRWNSLVPLDEWGRTLTEEAA